MNLYWCRQHGIKTEYHNSLSIVWKKAAQLLSEAENIFVIGYSLPESDSFFRYLYGLGTVGDFMLKRFWIFDPDQSGAVKSRFEETFRIKCNCAP